jgi:hypothetical protein
MKKSSTCKQTQQQRTCLVDRQVQALLGAVAGHGEVGGAAAGCALAPIACSGGHVSTVGVSVVLAAAEG